MLNAATTEGKPLKVKRQSEFVVVARRLSKNSSAVIGFVVAVLLVLMAIFAPLIAPYPYAKQDLSHTRAAPSVQHIFGTDELGRDIFSRIVWEPPLSVGFCSSLGHGGWHDVRRHRRLFWPTGDDHHAPDRCSSIDPRYSAGNHYFRLRAGLSTRCLLSISGILMGCRLTRAAVLSVRHQEYLEAATSINASTARIILRHVLPNSFAPVLVSATMSIGNVIMAAAMLSFIGLGVQPPTPEWGSMIAGGRSLIRSCPWMVTFPGIFIMLTVLALNMFGDGLRDALDPKLKK
jgi:peptide/nickel transport system permease protein